MKVSRAQSEENRKTIIAAASQLFRERGLDGVGLSDLMNAAGLTHGGFYKKFASKSELAIQACAHAIDVSRTKWTRIVLKAREKPLPALVRHYLSERHRDDVGDGCAFASLASEVARHDAKLRMVFEDGIEAHLDLLDSLSSGEPDELTRNASIVALSTMVGALLLSRAVASPALSKRILNAAGEATIARSEVTM